MKRKIVLASHHRLADGLKDTLDFISGGVAEVYSLSAYMDNVPVQEQVQTLMQSFDDSDDLIILTDMTAGSVNQNFFSFRNRPHTHIISGMNLPLALGVALESADEYISDERIDHLIDSAKDAIVNVNALELEVDDEDE
jgi:PTS system mannose-specific IIA component